MCKLFYCHVSSTSYTLSNHVHGLCYSTLTTGPCNGRRLETRFDGSADISTGWQVTGPGLEHSVYVMDGHLL